MQVIQKSNIDLKAFLNQVSSQKLEVGFLEGHKYPADEYGNSPTVAEVALWNEFGTIKSPARSFMRPTFENQQENWKKIFNFSLVDSIKNNNPKQVFNNLGLAVQGDIKKTISQVTEPALSPITIKKKRSSKPLVDSGLLLNSIQYEVSEK